MMESLDGLMMRLGGGLAAVVLFVIAVLLAVLWLLTRRKLSHTTLVLEEKQTELDLKTKDRDQLVISSQAQVSKLKEQIRELNEHTYLSQFEPGHVYTLVAEAEARTELMPKYFGLVREEDGALVPFVVSDGLEEIQVGDRFGLVGGRLEVVAHPRADVEDRDALGIPLGAMDEIKHRMAATYAANQTHETILLRPESESLSPEDYYKGLPCIKVLDGNDRGAMFFLPFIQGKIGRDKSNSITLDDERTSRVHAFIDYRDHSFILRDNNSTNGTYHNGNQIEEAKLNFGDTITIGNTRMMFTSEGFELREKSPEKAVELFEKCLSVEPNFILGLKYLAFLLERDVRRQGESEPIYEKLKRLEKPV